MFYTTLVLTVDWTGFWTDIVKSLIVAAITAIAAVLFTKKYIGKISFANKMSKYGFFTSISEKDISDKEFRRIFSEADSIKFIFVSGKNFFQGR